MDKIDEGSEYFLKSVKFFDQNGAPVTPTSIKWQVYDKDTGTAMNTEQSVAVPAQEVAITIPVACNAMNDETKSEEVRWVEVRGGYSGGGVHNQHFEYGLVNLFGS